MPPPARKYDFLAAFLTYLIPGLGQVVQGRIGKGVLYFVCLYGLFIYGMALGQMKNVWLAKTDNLPKVQTPVLGGEMSGIFRDLSYRKEFLAQFWIGAFAWPALLQYQSTEPLPAMGADDSNWKPKPHGLLKTYMQAPSESELNELQRDGDKNWDLGWVFTVVAGVLNILVIYDALAGPLVKEEPEVIEGKKHLPTPSGGGK